MPASTLDPVSAALRTALNKNDSENSLDAQLVGSTKKALLSNIEFEPSGTYQSTVLDKLKSKYIVLKNKESPQASTPEEKMGADETLKVPKQELYALDSVQLGWNNCSWSIGSGMVNMGNSCYLNSTLQALFHVPALANWLMSEKDHVAKCQDSGTSCIICAMRKTLLESQSNSNPIRPVLIFNKLRILCRNMLPGRQEDAHEFLRYLVEAMEKSYLSRFKNHSEFDSRTKETTPLNQILGGYLRSDVRCLKCGHVSTTFQHFQDLLLDIRKAQTIDEALESYFSKEKLDDESYQCEVCQKKVPATKQFTLERAPMVLCTQLKRFSVSNNKITKHVTFRNRLDLTRYARHRPTVPLIYKFVALVTHIGPTVNCGHYTAVAQTPSGNYYQFDDCIVRPISQQAVFNTNAYIMLFELESSPFAQKSASAVNKVKSTLTLESSPVSSSSSTSISKTASNGIGYTSDKAYGPELPPNRVLKPANGVVSSSVVNGNGNKHNSSSTSDSDSEGESVIKPASLQKVNKVSSTPPTAKKNANSSTSTSDVNKTPSTPVSSTNCTAPSASTPNSSKISTSMSSPETAKKSKDTPNTTTPKSLVPYETYDTSCSEDSNHSAHDVESRVSTKAAVGDWQVTSSTNATPQPSSDEKSWEKGKLQNSSTVVNELLKMSHSGYSYSASVKTWNGTRSHLDKEVGNERREERKRTLQVDSTDMGRVKQAKVATSFKSNPGYNPVQEYHNGKIWGQNNGSNHYKPFYNGNRHRRNFHNKSYHNKNNYRFQQ